MSFAPREENTRKTVAAAAVLVDAEYQVITKLTAGVGAVRE